MELLETIVSHLVAAAIGAAIIWWPNRSIKRQFFALMEAIDEGKVQDRDWKFVRDAEGNPEGIRIMMGASAASDDPRAL